MIVENHYLKEGTKIYELIELANTLDDFTEKDIVDRSSKIMDAFLDYLKNNDLIN